MSKIEELMTALCQSTDADVVAAIEQVPKALGIDVKGMMATARAKWDDLKQLLGVLVSDVLIPAGDSTMATIRDSVSSP